MTAATAPSTPHDALVTVGRMLTASGYRFITTTPATHARVHRRGPDVAADLRDVFGWSRPAPTALFPPGMLDALRAADAVEPHGDLWQPRVRFSTLGDQLYVHSAYPTVASDAVFFGPDTYRFCAVLAREVVTARRVIDVGAGSGAGGLSLAGRVDQLVLTDINPRALAMAGVNAALAGVAARVERIESDVLASVDGRFDLVIANPPYLVDDQARAYRHGGDGLGTALAVRILDEALARLAPGGRVIVYTGAPIVDGRDRFLDAARPRLEARRARWTYAELDPDVFGEELDRPAYQAVERIAAVALCATVVG